MHKISRLSIFSVLLISVLLQITVLRHIAISGSLPDLALISVIFFGLFLGPGTGFWSGIFAGLLKDLSALDFFGINIFIFGLVGLSAGLVSTKIFKESVITQALVVFSFTVSSMALHYWLAGYFARSVILSFYEYLTSSIIPAGVYTSFVAVFVFGKFIKMYDLQAPEEFL